MRHCLAGLSRFKTRAYRKAKRRLVYLTNMYGRCYSSDEAGDGPTFGEDNRLDLLARAGEDTSEVDPYDTWNNSWDRYEYYEWEDPIAEREGEEINRFWIPAFIVGAAGYVGYHLFVLWLSYGRSFSSDEAGDGPFQPGHIAIGLAGAGVMHLGSRTLESVETAIEIVAIDAAKATSGWINLGISFVACAIGAVFLYLLKHMITKFGRRYRSDNAGDGPQPITQRAGPTEAGTRTAISEARARASTLIRGTGRPIDPITGRPIAIQPSSSAPVIPVPQPKGKKKSEETARSQQSSGHSQPPEVSSAGHQSQDRWGCATGVLRFLPEGRRSSAAPASSASATPPSETVPSLRLAQEASDLRSRARDLQYREEELSSSYERLEQQRELLRKREEEVRSREAALHGREERIRVREQESNWFSDSNLGTMISIMPASDTLRTWVRVVETASRCVFILFYTFDLDILATALEAAAKRQVKVCMIGDRQRVRQTKGTTALLQRMKVKNIGIRLRDGEPLSAHYTVGNPSKLVENKQGQVHSKFLMADSDLVMGSTNFTTASQCNVETSAHIRLTSAGTEELTAHFHNLYEDAEPL